MGDFILSVNIDILLRSYTQYTPFDIIGLVLFSLGLLCEAVSDQQKFNFR